MGNECTVCVDDLIFPTNPATTPYYYKATTGGTSGIAEPVWGTSPGSTIPDGSVVWEYVERLIQPITQGPIIPTLV